MQIINVNSLFSFNSNVSANCKNNLHHKTMQMKIITIIFLFYFVIGLKSGFGQTVIQSTCATDSSEYYIGIDKFAYEIALREMKNNNHYLHDSILVPKLFLDSIKQFVVAYHNAIDLTDSIIDYRNFNDFKLDFGTIRLTFDKLSNCTSQQNNSNIITNDILKEYIDSLSMEVIFENENQVALLDPNNRINIYGDFSFFNNVSCVIEVTLILGTGEPGPCYTARSGLFRDNKLYLHFNDYKYCGSNSYSHEWTYSITRDCKIEILDVSTGTKNILKENELVIYPNPFDDKIYFESNNKVENVKLLGINGRTYGQGGSEDPKYFSTTDLPSGVYIIEIKFKKGNNLRKILIKK